MKSIRQIALEKDEPKTEHRHFGFDEDDYGYGKQSSLFDGRKTSFRNTDGQMTIRLSIPNKKLGVSEFEYGDNYNPEALAKAEEVALKEITKFAGSDWQERYSYSIEDCLPMWSDVEIEIVLTKN